MILMFPFFYKMSFIKKLFSKVSECQMKLKIERNEQNKMCAVFHCCIYLISLPALRGLLLIHREETSHLI